MLLVCLATDACSSNRGPASPALDEQAATNNDPLEGMNRAVWSFDMKADKYVLRPVAVAYRDNIPNGVRRGITNVISNMKQPLIMANDVLQANPAHFSQAFARFITNTLFGLGGIFDTATALKIPYHESDFGQTLGRWGLPPGPYLVLPILGPSDPRDAVGYGVESFTDPVSFELRLAGADAVVYSRTGIGIVNDRARHLEDLDELQRSSLDFYAAVRSLYQQQRTAAVSNAAFPPSSGQLSEGSGSPNPPSSNP